MSTTDPLSDKALFETLMASPSDSVYFKDRESRLLRVSLKMAQSLGFENQADLIGKTDVDLFGPAFGRVTRAEEVRIMETGHPLVGAIESRQMQDGRTNWTQTTKRPIYDDDRRIIGVWGITREINEIRQAEVNLQYLATHDSLTKLPNRFLMTDRLNQLLARISRTESQFALLFFDLDHFKSVNDSLGHEAGDLLLQTVALRLTESLRSSDTVARLGGDEFVVILETLQGLADAEKVALNIQGMLAEPYFLGERGEYEVQGSASIGLALYPSHGRDVDTLLRSADHAMYLAKRAGGNRYQICPTDCDDPLPNDEKIEPVKFDKAEPVSNPEKGEPSVEVIV
jgi:diguanylate cyclase (GGDEF)-like protein/PAS domain S-box-containing protein